MMKMMIYRTYPLVNYTIDPEHQHFFVETNLPTHQKPEIAEKSPDFYGGILLDLWMTFHCYA